MEDLEYFHEKQGQRMFAAKKMKFGTDMRCGATWRRDYFDQMQKKLHRHVIAKHVTMAEELESGTVEEEFDLDDGGLTRYRCFKANNKRGKGARSAVAENLNFGRNFTAKNNRNVLYSMNKKKRWLLPELVKSEIQSEKATTDELKADVNLTIVERELKYTNSYQRFQFPDTVNVDSTALSDKENFPRLRKKRKSRRHKYGYSTDLLGLSQKVDESDSAEPAAAKSEVTYEICYSRSGGPYATVNTNSYFARYERCNRRGKERWKELCREEEAESISMDEDDHLEYASDDDHPADYREPPNIASWIQMAENGRRIEHHVRKRKVKTSSKTSSLSSKKGKVVYRPQKEDAQEENKKNLLETMAAEEHFTKVLKNEDEVSISTLVSLQSLLRLRESFYAYPPCNTSTFQGVTVTKSRSRPEKYSFQMKDQMAVKLESREVKTAIGYFILEPVSDPSKCRNKENCFTHYQHFCVCHEYVPVRFKVALPSDEEKHKECLKIWKDKLDSIMLKTRPGCPGLYLQKVLSIATNTFNVTATEQFDPSSESNAVKRHKISAKIAPYQRKVMAKAAALLGFSYNLFDPVHASCQSKSEEDESSSDPVIVNHNPRDFCEICYCDLSENDKDYQATSLSKCNHWFCHECWRKHLVTVARSTASQSLICPGFECNVAVDDVTLMALLPGDVLWQYQRRQIQNAVKRSENLHSCPQCLKTVQVANGDHSRALKRPLPLSCACEAWWCSHCKEEPHWPATCAEAEAYKAEVARLDNKELIKTVSGRRCPTCHERIEKDGGCQMVHCVCGTMFCWKCLKPYSECLYECHSADPNLETWSLSSKGTDFFEAVEGAMESAKAYRSLKLHRRRLAACRKAAEKVIGARLKKNCERREKQREIRQMEEKLQEVLLHCDALHSISQYLAVSVSLKKRGRKSPYPKLRRFLLRLDACASSIEHTLLNGRIGERLPLDQKLDQKVASSLQLLRFLMICVNFSTSTKA